MKHFKEEGAVFRSVGAAGRGTSTRKVVLVSMGFFGFVFMAVILFVLRSSDANPAVYAIVPIFILSFVFSIMVLGRTLGSGTITVDTSTGTVTVRNTAFCGFGSRKLQRSDIESVVLQGYSSESTLRYRLMLHTSGEGLMTTGLTFRDTETAREAGMELASLLSVALREETSSHQA
ncbi:MAG TPA: hypothetical protein PK907_05890 [Candidatus Sabulitectum sp.]|nr:hypothetical protein [Candidatus Sabulitectum sp.]